MGSQVEGEEEYDGEDMQDSAADDDIFKNNHDLIGVQGILRAQKNEIEKKKVSFLSWYFNALYKLVGTENGKWEILQSSSGNQWPPSIILIKNSWW